MRNSILAEWKRDKHLQITTIANGYKDPKKAKIVTIKIKLT